MYNYSRPWLQVAQSTPRQHIRSVSALFNANRRIVFTARDEHPLPVAYVPCGVIGIVQPVKGMVRTRRTH